MAFAPEYPTNGLFYVYYTAKTTGQITIEERRVDPANPDRADPAYARPLVTIPHNLQPNHNGGQLQFGPDDALYAGTGDGGSGGDPSNNAQTTTPGPPTEDTANNVNHDYRLGKLLRIDPATGALSIFAYGLRNPWRFSYDRNTGDLIIGDVGQDATRRSTSRPRPATGRGRTTAGTPTRALTPTRAGRRRAPPPARSCRSSSTRTPRRARSRAATWCATRRCPSSPAPTSTATTAPATSRPPRCRRAARARWASTCRGSRASARTAAARVYAASLSGPVYRFASSGACAGPAPRFGRLPAGVAATPAVAAPDHRAPAITLLRAAARQHALRTGFVTIRVRCDELCTVRASGRVLITRRAHAAAAAVLRTRTARATLVANARTTLHLKLSKATRRAIKRSLARRGRRATVRITLRAADRAGNARTATRRVRIVR